MTPRLAILSGARAGAVEPLTGQVASIGRHVTCHIRLDPDQDTTVSTRHAVVQRKDGGWTVRDLGSAQGTYVNGARISAEHPLNDGDTIRLGAAGPELQFLLSDRAQVAEPSRAPAAEQPAKPAITPEQMAQIIQLEQAGQLSRDMADAARKRSLLRVVAGTALVVLVMALAVTGLRQRAIRKAEEAARDQALARADSLMASVGRLEVSAPAMRSALDSARKSAMRLRGLLSEGGQHPTATAAIMASLDSVVAREREIAAAAAFNAQKVAAPSREAVALVVAQYADGSSIVATGFAVRRDGTGGVLLTTKPVAVNAAGEAPVQILVLFPGTALPIPARVLASHATEDVALLRVEQRGGVPVVQGLGWKDPPVTAGAPLALMGYAPPVPMPPDGDLRKADVATTTMTGSAILVSTGFVTVDAWGASVSQGTPVMDGQGLVAGLISSAPPSKGGRLYDAVPVKFALELLDQLQ